MTSFKPFMVKTDRSRRGTVLVIVVAILAVLMIFAATLALTTRVEMKTSENYEYNEALSFLQDAVEQYAVDILKTDKYGGDDVPYNYEKLGSAHDIYPSRSDGDGFNSDDENFDSYENEEWLSPEDGSVQSWRLFYHTTPGIEMYDSDGDGTYDRYANWLGADWILGENASLMGGKAKGEFALCFFDAGGGRLDVNVTGNDPSDTNPSDNQNQGISSFEIALSLLTSQSGDYVYARYGDQNYPQVRSKFPYGQNNLDFNADGTVEDSISDLSNPSDSYFNPEWPLGPEQPYNVGEFSSILFDNTSWPGGSQNITTHSGTTIIAGRSIRGAWNNTNPTTTVLGGYAVLNQTPWPKDGDGNDLVVQRAIQDMVPNITDAIQSDAEDLAKFIWDLEPEFNFNSGSPTTEQKKVLIQQIAVNLLDMIDTGDAPISFSRDFDNSSDYPNSGGGTTYNFYGVEPTPYITEVEAAIDTSKYAFIPDPGTGDLPDPADTEPPATSGDLSGNYSRFVVGSHNIAELLHGILEEDTDGNGTPDVTTDFWWYAQQNLGTYTDGDYQLEKNGTHDWTLVEGKTNSETWGNYTFTIDTLPDNNPPTGWGKYIKLVNPWNDTIQLDDGTNSYYRLYFTGQGRGHYWDTTTHTWATQNMTIGTADGSGGYIELEGEVPARGHFIIIDGDNIAFNVPSNSDHYQVEKTLNYLLPAGQEIVLEKTDTPGVWDSTAEVVTVMTFTYPDTNSLERDDDSLSTSTTESVQIGDPRPSWYRNGDQNEPWGPDAWVTDSNKTAEWNSTDSYWDWGSTDTTQLGWFNKNWQDGDMGTAGIQPIGEGDYPSSGSFTEQENVDNLLESFPPVQEDDLYTGVTGDNTKIMNNGLFPSPGAIGFIHAGISWGTVSLTNPTASDIGATDIVYLKNFTDYLVGPVSPYENGVDDDGDDSLSADNLIDDDGAHEDDRFGPEIRLRGKVNVNTAPEEVLKATFKNSWLEAMWNGASDRASAIANAIVNERNTNGPYSSVDDFFNRNLEIFEVDIDGDDLPDGDVPNSARREALARFMYNLVTVRTDVWGVVGKVRIYDDNKYGTGDSRTNNNQCDDGEEIASQTFHMVVDRSFDPPRIVLRKSGD